MWSSPPGTPSRSRCSDRSQSPPSSSMSWFLIKNILIFQLNLFRCFFTETMKISLRRGLGEILNVSLFLSIKYDDFPWNRKSVNISYGMPFKQCNDYRRSFSDCCKNFFVCQAGSTCRNRLRNIVISIRTW
jgi:hypothetical protein